MAFDTETRSKLQSFVTDIRTLLTDDFTRQLQQTYGMDPVTGEVTPLDSLKHLDDESLATAKILRDVMDHYLASEAKKETQTRISVLKRIAREQAFSILNRLAALRMMEARGILLKSIGQGTQSQAFQLYQPIANGSLGDTGETYKHFLFSLFDLFTADLPSLFDRYGPQSRLFPRNATLTTALGLINNSEIELLWSEDETIGWIYQYFNSKEERKAMRDASQAPRNSRELAVRNQFFTPRYVVEFLVDNTLGRLWLNWTGGQTDLRDRCQYLLVKPDEQPKATKHLRDPRTIKLLDPACGSMHFGLYAFDLFMEIYGEAWAWEQTHGRGCLDSETGGSADLKPLCETYADRDAFMNDVPRLIIEYNIYGVDIDPRAAQIASLALWLRAQRAWHETNVKAKDRPRVGRGQVVAAVAPPAEVDLLKRFMEELDPLDAELFEKTLFMLKGLPELGVLLQVEKELPALVRQVFGEHGDLFRKDDMATWQKAEARLQEALAEFARAARSTYQGRLFAEDALQGLRMIDQCENRYDVLVMNPPFGELNRSHKSYIDTNYPGWAKNILTCFITRSFNLLRPHGLCGAIFDRTIVVKSSYEAHRREVWASKISNFLDTGWGVLDANVETACACFAKSDQQDAKFLDLRSSEKKQELLMSTIQGWKEESTDPLNTVVSVDPRSFLTLPNSVIGYDFDKFALNLFSSQNSLENSNLKARQGHALVSKMHFRVFWELDSQKFDSTGGHSLLYNGSEFTSFVSPDRDVVVKGSDAGFLSSHPSVVLRNPGFQFLPGIAYGKRGQILDAHVLEAGRIFTTEGQSISSNEQIEVNVGLALLNSRMYQYLLNLYSGQHKYSGYLNLLPKISMSDKTLSNLCLYTQKIIKIKSKWMQHDETCISFNKPISLLIKLGMSDAVPFEMIIEDFKEDRQEFLCIMEKINHEVEACAELDEGEVRKLKEWANNTIPYDPIWPGVDKERYSGLSEQFIAESVISELVGVLFGRWAMTEEGITIPNTFYPSGFDLKSTNDHSNNGLVIEAKNICNNEGLPRSIYEDDGGDSDHFLRSFNGIFENVFGHGAERIEAAITNALGTTSVDDYLRESSGFFADHLQRYTKSRREAPIYWPISTSSGRYTLWLYYPSLTDQTLFTAINDFIEPKLRQVGQDVAFLRKKDSARSAVDEKILEKLQALEAELIELRESLLEIAPTYRPNHDDGVQISSAPLWRLFRHKPWQKVLKATWDKLENGDYEWAHLAMAYWPDRVREKCKTDKSLAIAHDLENLYEEPEIAPGAKRGRKTTGGNA